MCWCVGSTTRIIVSAVNWFCVWRFCSNRNETVTFAQFRSKYGWNSTRKLTGNVWWSPDEGVLCGWQKLQSTHAPNNAVLFAVQIFFFCELYVKESETFPMKLTWIYSERQEAFSWLRGVQRERFFSTVGLSFALHLLHALWTTHELSQTY